MDFISQSEVTKEAVDYINSKLKEHISFTDIVGACESLKNAENKKIKSAMYAYIEKMKRAGYSKDNKLNIYVKKEEQIPKKEETKTPTNEPINYEKMALDIHDASKRMKKETKNLGIYIYPSIQKELKKLDQEFYYLTNNLIIDALIHLFSGLSEYETLLENYKQQFAKVMMEEKKKKKQITYKISKQTMTKLERVNKQFDYLSKSDLVNFILLVLLDQLKIQNKKDQSNDQS
jgi:hypothetical protein